MCYHVKSLDAHQCRITCMKCMHRLTHLIKLTYFKHVSIFFQEKHFGGSSDFSHVNLLDEVKTDIRRRLIDIDTKRQVPEFHQRRTTWSQIIETRNTALGCQYVHQLGIYLRRRSMVEVKTSHMATIEASEQRVSAVTSLSVYHAKSVRFHKCRIEEMNPNTLVT